MTESWCASYHTLSGSQHGKPPTNQLLARAAAASSAGIPAIGASCDDLLTESQPERVNGDYGIVIPELEWLNLDAVEPGDEMRLLTMARRCGSSRVNVGVCTRRGAPLTLLARNLRRIAQRAGEHGLTVCVEPVVFGSLREPEDVVRLLDMAAQPNTGMLWDIWHIAHLEYGLEGYDMSRVAAVQVSGVRPGSFWAASDEELFRRSQCDRLLPHQGRVDVRAYLQSLSPDVPVSVEVISDELRSMSCTDAAAAIAASMAAVLPQAVAA